MCYLRVYLFIYQPFRAVQNLRARLHYKASSISSLLRFETLVNQPDSVTAWVLLHQLMQLLHAAFAQRDNVHVQLVNICSIYFSCMLAFVWHVQADEHMWVCSSVCLAGQIRACAARSCQIVSHHLRLNELSSDLVAGGHTVCVNQSGATEVRALVVFLCSLILDSALSASTPLMFNITSHAFISVLLNPSLIESGWICSTCYCRLWWQ